MCPSTNTHTMCSFTSRSFYTLPVATFMLKNSLIFHHSTSTSNHHSLLHLPISLLSLQFDTIQFNSIPSQEMASEASSFIENLINSRNRDISLFLPFIIGLNAAEDNPGSPPDRIVLINPFTQGMVVIERSSSENSNRNSSLGFEALLDELLSRKSGRPPASKASIEAMESVEIGGVEDEGGDQCVICLEEWEAGEKAKRMPCKHRFHGECIEKWLNIHGSCPVCRYEMPVDGSDDEKKRSGGGSGGGGERRREIWVSFMFGGERRSGESDGDSS